MKNIEKYYYAITDNLKTKSGQNLGCSVFDIRYGDDYCGDTDCLECCLKSLEWLNEEYKEPKHILNDQEKEIVKAMCDAIYRFGCDEVISVCKIGFGMRCNFISISYKNEYSGVDETMASPIFRNDLFAGMELRKRYSLEELEITCQTQKDSFGRR